MSDNVVDANFNDQQEALAKVRKNMDAWIEMQKLIAKVRKAAYDAHIAEGFTEAQALELVKTLGS